MLAQLRQVSRTNRRTYGDNIADDLFHLFFHYSALCMINFQLQFQRNVNREQKVKLIELTEL